MGLTYIDAKMIQPAVFPALTAINLYTGTFATSSIQSDNALFSSLSANSLSANSGRINNLNVTNLTATNATIYNLSAINPIANIAFTNATADSLVVAHLTAVSDYFVQTIPKESVSRTFTSADNSKAFHFDTTDTTLSAIFPSSLPTGFNVSLYNISNGTIALSSNTYIHHPGETIPTLYASNSTKYTGAFIYKANDEPGVPQGIFYGVGVFQ